MAFLSGDEIHLWLVDEDSVSDDLLPAYRMLLSVDELARLERFHFAVDRRRFLITRAAIRNTLSHYVSDVPPAQWQFARHAHGRPFIAAPELTHGLTFNIAHTSGLIVIAVAVEGELGVDVESMDRDSRTVEVAERFFSPTEVAAMRALPAHEQRARFFDLWTLKEAWIKAIGTGLATPLDSFSFDLSAEKVTISFAQAQHGDPSRWQFWQWRPSEKNQIAVAFAGQRPMNIRSRKLVPMKSMEYWELSAFSSS